MGWGRNLYDLVRIPIRRPCKGYYLRWYYNGWHYWFFAPGSYSVQTEGEAYRTIGTRQIQMISGQINRGQAQAIRTIMNTREVYLLTIAGWMNIRLEPGSLIVYDNKQQGVEIEFTAVIGSKEVSYGTGFTPVPGDGTLPEVPVVPPDPGYCELIIGNQIWMCKNFDSNFPGSKAYQDNEAYAAIYGRLYSWSMLTNPGFAPEGWHVPTLADWNKLFDFVGGIAFAGGELKEAGFDHWQAPNTDAVDTYGMALLPGGLLTNYSNILINQAGFFWTFTEQNYNQSYAVRALYNSAAMSTFSLSKYGLDFASVRLIKDSAAPPLVWYLPSLDEAALIYTVLVLGAVGGFSADSHWTSSEFDNDEVWQYNYFLGASFRTAKVNALKIDAVRTLTTTVNYALTDEDPLGGWIFKKTDNGDGTYTYLLAMPYNFNTLGYQWSNITNILIGTTGTAVGTGLSNSQAIINQPGHTLSAASIIMGL